MKYYDRSMTKMKVKNRKIVILLMFWKLNMYLLKTKIQFYVRSKLNHFYKPNSSLSKFTCDPSLLVIQDFNSTDSNISNDIHETNRKKTNSTYKSEQIMTTNKSNPKSVPTKNSAIIFGNSIVKHLMGLGIFKKNHVKIKTDPGATTEDIIDYIKPSIWKKLDFLLVH